VPPRRKSSEDGAPKPKKPLSERQRAHLAKATAAARESGRSGAPSSYEDKFAKVARLMCQNGATDADLADALEVSTRTISRWQAKHPAFGEALKVHKGEFDNRVERALAQRAVGYSFDTEKIFMAPGSREPVRVPFREHVPPDPTAAFKWLNCRRPTEWRNSSELALGVDALSPLVALLAEIDGGTVSLIEERDRR